MKKRSKLIATFDFCTLFTKLPHVKVKSYQTKILLDYLIMVQHTEVRKQKGDLDLVKHHLKQL